MKSYKLALLIAFAVVSMNSFAAGEHPAYLKALSNLREARFLINHNPGKAERTADEVAAERAIDVAIAEIKKAAIDDGKNLNDHPAADQVADKKADLNRAVELLRKSRAEVNEKEDDKFGNGLKVRALHSIDQAISFTIKAMATKK